MKSNDNRWKLAFFLLFIPVIIAIVVIFGFIIYFLNYTSHNNLLPNEEIHMDETYFMIKSTKSELNNFFAKQIRGNYSIKLEEDYGALYTSVEVLSMNVPTEVIFIPEKQANGNIILKIHEINLAGFRLPEKLVLQYIQESIQLPNYVHVDVANKLIYILVNEVEVSEGLFLYVNEFNLREDKITFSLISKIER